MSIELKDISYTYLKNTSYKQSALNNINLTINDGEYIGIVGKTGSGKSTLLDILSGLVKPDKGEVIYRGIDRSDIGVIFQFVEKQLFETTVEKDVGFALKNRGIKDITKIKEVIEYMGFDYEEAKDKSPLEFSIGEKRKIAIAGVLVTSPKYLILDEPFASLDYDGKSQLIKMLNDLHLKGTTIIIISHSIDIICELTDRVIVLDNGKIISDKETKTSLNGYDGGYISKLTNKLNIANCLKYEDLLNEIEKRYKHE